MTARIGWGVLSMRTVRHGYRNMLTGSFADAERPSVWLGALIAPIAIGDPWIILPSGLGVIPARVDRCDNA